MMTVIKVLLHSRCILLRWNQIAHLLSQLQRALHGLLNPTLLTSMRKELQIVHILRILCYLECTFSVVYLAQSLFKDVPHINLCLRYSKVTTEDALTILVVMIVQLSILKGLLLVDALMLLIEDSSWSLCVLYCVYLSRDKLLHSKRTFGPELNNCSSSGLISDRGVIEVDRLDSLRIYPISLI